MSRRINEILNLPVTELTDEELVKVVRKRWDAKSVIFIYLSQDNTVQWLTRWASTKNGGDAGRRFCSKFHKAWDKILESINQKQNDKRVSKTDS